MSSIKRKLKRNVPVEHIKKSDIKLSMRFVCPKCHASRIISQDIIKNMKEEEFKNNKLFICEKCNKRMYPHQVLADY